MKSLEKEIRPWGKFYVLIENKKFKIKKIKVKPGHRLSYQYHNKRSETWVILQGICNVTINDEENIIKEGETIFIPKRAKHRVQNTGDKMLIFIEIQTGEYFGEDDIVRVDDDYKRT